MARPAGAHSIRRHRPVLRRIHGREQQGLEHELLARERQLPDLSYCPGLRDVRSLANLCQLSTLILSASGDRMDVYPTPARNYMSTRDQVAEYQELIKKSIS